MFDNNVEDAYMKYLKFTDDLALTHAPLNLAATMLTIALQLYKTALTEEDYNSMVDSISDMRGEVKKFDFSAAAQAEQADQ